MGPFLHLVCALCGRCECDQRREERDVQVFQAGGFLHLSDPLGIALGTVQLFAANGSMARSLQVRTDRTSMDLNELNSGLYVVRVIAADGRSTSRSILIP